MDNNMSYKQQIEEYERRIAELKRQEAIENRNKQAQMDMQAGAIGSQPHIQNQHHIQMGPQPNMMGNIQNQNIYTQQVNKQQQKQYIKQQQLLRQQMLIQQAQQAGTGKGNVNATSNSGINIESFIGKNLMAVVASILIFVSLIVMCSVVFPFMSDIVKVGALYSISLAMISFGYIMLRKSRNTWYTTLTACGMTAMYISLFLSNTMFNVIEDIPLYIALLVWAIANIWLTRKFSKIFTAIGCIGVEISLVLGSIQYMSDYAPSTPTVKIVLIAVFAFVAIIVFNSGNDKDSLHNVVVDIFNVLALFTIGVGVINYSSKCFNHSEQLYNINGKFSAINTDMLILASIIVLVVVLVSIYRLVYYNVRESDYMFQITTVFYSIMLIILTTSISNCLKSIDYAKLPLNIVAYTITLVLAGLAVYRLKEDDIKLGLYVIPVTIALVILHINTPLQQVTGNYILAILLVVLGFMLNKSVCKYCGIFTLMVSMIVSNRATWEVSESAFHINASTAMMLSLLESIVSIAIILALILKYKEQYKASFKALTLLFGIVGVIIFQVTNLQDELDVLDFHTSLNIQLMLLFIAIVSVVNTKLCNNILTNSKEKATEWIFRVACETSIMPISVVVILASYNRVDLVSLLNLYWTSAILIAFAVFNAKFTRSLHKEVGTLYSAIKWTFVTWWILAAITSGNLTFSIITILIASISIAYGFNFKIKSLRIYGLILALIGTVKLTMFDIQFGGTLGKAICLFLCGILCFIISFMYNRIDKKVTKDNKQQTMGCMQQNIGDMQQNMNGMQQETMMNTQQDMGNTK